MALSLLDWLTIAAYLAVTLVLGLYFRARSSRSVDDYFVSGRNVNWWLAGTSMVATTFAADTPLVVAGLVYTQGISGNWLWWGFLLSGMMTVFLFARLWRRSGLLTDVQFVEIRYSGKPAAFLRGFRAVYLGLLMNCIILGWVTKAMTSIVSHHAGRHRPAHPVGASAQILGQLLGRQRRRGAGGLRLLPDSIDRALRLARRPLGRAVDGPLPVRAQDVHRHRHRLVQPWRRSAECTHCSSDWPRHARRQGRMRLTRSRFFPSFGRGLGAQIYGCVPVAAFLVYIGLQWWAFWYPGAEPGGGGYIAQRIFSARDERQGLLSVLWFNIAQYAMRPWPWIVTALAVIVLYPGLQHPERGYMLAMNQNLPHSLRGLAIAGFLAAFMSTIATQLNWGASYLVSDFYRRFIHRSASQRHYVIVSRLATVLLVIASAWVSVNLASIGKGWQLVMEIGAGTGAVYMLRWYWWRVNAWSEISAMASSLVTSVWLYFRNPFSGSEPVVFAKTALTTTLCTTAAWVAVTLLTPPESETILTSFYRKVRPDVRMWKPIARLVGDTAPTRDLGGNLVNWVLGCVMVYCALFGTGKVILREPLAGVALLAASAMAAWLLYGRIRRSWSAEAPGGEGE